MAELTCPHCGAAVQPGDIYCPTCTRSLRLSAPEVSSDIPSARQSRTFGWVVGLGVIGVCALAAFPLLIVPAMRVRSQGFPPTAARPATTSNCNTNVKQLSIAAMLYLSDNDDKLFLGTKFESQLMPYVKASAVFYCPDTGQPYAVNKEVLGKEFNKFKNPATTPMFYEGTGQKLSSAHSGGAHVGYADSHVKRVTATAKINWKP